MSEKTSSKIILITGSSSGFGLLTAARLAARGHTVYASMRNIKNQTALLSEVNKRQTQVEVLELDVTKPETIKKAVNQIAEHHGYLDVLINNAGYGIGGAFEDLTDDDIRQQMETNFFGVQHVTRAAIPMMRQRKGAKIINVSSVLGFSTSPGFGAYSCSKWALESFTETLRYELKVFGIDVLLVEPGTYQTKIFAENRRYAKNFDNENSPYYDMSQHLRKRVDEHVEQCKKDPEAVAAMIENLIESKRTAFRNHPDFNSKFLYCCRKLLPFGLYSWLIEKGTLKGYQHHNGHNSS